MRTKIRGYQERPNGFMAYVKVGKEQRTKLFPRDTIPEVMEAWRANTRLELTQARPAKGTLAGDIETFLTRVPEGRRKVDFKSWLSKWAASPLGTKPRTRITREDIVQQFARWGSYSGSSKNHLRQVLLSLWKDLDGRGAACPAREVDGFEESPARRGFFEPGQVQKLVAALTPDYADVVEFASITGWRREEVQGLRWEEIDFAHSMIRLSPQRAKNREGREFPLGPVEDIIERRLALKEDRQELPLVFTRVLGGKKTRRRVLPIKSWGKAWTRACKEADCDGRMMHDFRRTAVRNLDKLGVSRSVAMKLVGHKTESIYRRYRIVDEPELHAAGELLKRSLK